MKMKNPKSKLLFSMLFAIIFLAQIISAQEKVEATSQTQAAPALPKGVSIYQLDNGIHVLLIENPALPMVGANMIIKVGSAYESFSTSGMSHMLEHLLFNGTTTRIQKQLYDDVDMIGGYNNASTTEFYTNFMMVTPTENIRKGMEIQADMLFNSTLPNEKFEKEKGIVLEEIYGKANSGQVNYDANPQWATGFQNSIIEATTDKTYYRFYDGEEKTVQLFFPISQKGSGEYFQLMQMVLDKNKEAIQTAIKNEFQQNIKSVKFATRLTPIKNYLEATIIITKDVDLNAVANSVSSKLANINFSLPIETLNFEATKARTEFVRNIEKPHMFGIYNSSAIVLEGIESVIASFSGNELYKAAKELEPLKISSKPLVLVQTPSVKGGKEATAVVSNVKQFKDDATGKNLIVVQNEVSNLLAIHYLVKHKAVYESKYGKDAAKILHDCLDQRFKSPENQKVSSKYGFTYTVNDNPMIPMDDIYLHPDFGYVRVEGLADDLTGAINYLNGVFTDFTPTEAEFKKSVEKFKGMGMMMMGGDKPKKVFEADYKALVYEPNSLTQNQPELTYQNMLSFAKEYFQPSNMIISVVSPGSPEAVNTLFNTLKYSAIQNEPAVFTNVFQTKTKPETIDKPGGGERSYLFYGFVSEIDKKDAPAIQVLSLVLSDNIVFDIREKQGMAYGMSAGIEVNGNKALFFINQGTRPQNVDKLIPQYPRFFEMKAIDTLSQKTVEKSINMYLGRMMFRRLSSINQAFYLGSSAYFFNDYSNDKNFLDALKAVKLADVKAVAKKYMKKVNPMTLIVR